MAEMTPLARCLLEDLEILLEDVIDADQHINPETGEVYPSILLLCKRIITLSNRFDLALSPAIRTVASQ